MESITVGFIGTGAMGEHMCRHIAQSNNYRVLAYDLNQAPLERLTQYGVTIASNCGELAEDSNVTILSLPGGPEVEAICNDILFSKARKDWTVIDMLSLIHI